MKVSEFLGKKVVDNKAMDIGKISDMIIEPTAASIKSMMISTGDFSFTRKEFEIYPEDIDQVGDYVLLKLERAELELRAESNSK